MELKEIPENTAVHTPTEEEAKELLGILHENGYKWSDNGSLIECTHWECNGCKMCYCIDCRKKVSFTCRKWFEVNGDTVLTLAEFKKKYCEEEKPQFLPGDLVRVVNLPASYLTNRIGEIMGPCAGENKMKTLYESLLEAQKIIDDNFFDLIDDNMEAKETEQGEKGNNSEDSRLNLCELLAGHVGEELYSPVFGVCTLRKIFDNNNNGHQPLINVRLANGDTRNIAATGHLSWAVAKIGEVILFPSRELYEQYPLDPLKAWMKWQEEQTQYKVHLMLDAEPEFPFLSEEDSYEFAFRTPADRDKCVEEIKAIIEKYSK